MNILITGCPRGGTKYVSRVFNRVGINVGHECIREHGCCSGFYVGDFNSYPVSHPTPVSQINWTTQIHLIRNPYKSIPSLVCLLRDVVAVRRWYEGIGIGSENLTEFAMNVWHWSHTQVRRNLSVDLTINLEWLPDHWSYICNTLGLDVKFPYKVRIENAYPFKENITRKDLEEINYERAIQVHSLWLDMLKDCGVDYETTGY